MEFSLPTNPVPAGDQSPRCLIIYGAPKIGKSSILPSIPGNLIVDAENGSDYLTALKVKVNTVEEFAAFETAIKKANRPYRFLSFDTIDAMETMCEVEATRRYKASTIGKNFMGKSVLELDRGGGYLHLRNCFYEYFQRFRALAQYTIFVGHVRDALLTGDGTFVSFKDLDLTGKIKNISCAYADAIGHCYRTKEGKLTISFKTVENITCGSRAQHLCGKDFVFDQPATVENWKSIYLTL